MANPDRDKEVLPSGKEIVELASAYLRNPQSFRKPIHHNLVTNLKDSLTRIGFNKVRLLGLIFGGGLIWNTSVILNMKANLGDFDSPRVASLSGQLTTLDVAISSKEHAIRNELDVPTWNKLRFDLQQLENTRALMESAYIAERGGVLVDRLKDSANTTTLFTQVIVTTTAAVTTGAYLVLRKKS